MIDIDKIVEQFKEAAKLHRDSLLEGDYKTANKSTSVMRKIYYLLTNEPEAQSKIYNTLLGDADPSVATWAAAHCLGFGEHQKTALTVLEEISNRKDIGILSLNAEMTIKVWKKQGYLKF